MSKTTRQPLCCPSSPSSTYMVRLDTLHIVKVQSSMYTAFSVPQMSLAGTTNWMAFAIVPGHTHRIAVRRSTRNYQSARMALALRHVGRAEQYYAGNQTERRFH